MDIMRRGEKAGILCLSALVASFIAAFIFGVGESVMGDIVSLILYLVVCVTYLLLVLAVQEIVKSVGDAEFARRMRHFLVVMTISCIFSAPLMAPLFVPDLFEAVLGLMTIVFIAVLGVISIRMAPSFGKLEGHRAEHGKKAEKWFKVSGWLMATVVLSIIGVCLSLIADFYMWRLVKQERMYTEGKS